MEAYFVQEGPYLMHHGILGMKWGVRRYQNYDGSYTKAGMKRYNKSLENYNTANENYKTVKTLRKASKKGNAYIGDQQVNVTKDAVKSAKQERKVAKKQLVKDYKHLKQDKLGDQGKRLYAEGKTITGNNTVTGILAGVSALSLNSIRIPGKRQLLNKLGFRGVDESQLNKILAGIAVGTGSIAAVKGVKDYRENKRLRAYYSHTSNY